MPLLKEKDDSITYCQYYTYKRPVLKKVNNFNIESTKVEVKNGIIYIENPTLIYAKISDVENAAKIYFKNILLGVLFNVHIVMINNP